MKFKIAHLYYDLMNLYGEQGNILALKKAFKDQKITTEVDLLSVGDKIDFKAYDIFYMGTGSGQNLLIVLEDIKKYDEDIKTAIKNNQYFIITGNAHELFGKYIQINDHKYNALGIFDYYAIENPQRIVGQSLMSFKNLKPIIGFQNRACCLVNNDNHLFSVTSGFAGYAGGKYEGYHENNFYGTYQLGPLLIRNPHFTSYIVKAILKKKYKKPKPTFEDKAYDEYIKNFYEKS